MRVRLGHIQGNLPLRVCEATRPSARFSGKFCPQGNIRGKEFLTRGCAQKWVPPKVWRFCATLDNPRPIVYNRGKRRIAAPQEGDMMQHQYWIFDMDGTLTDSMPIWAEVPYELVRGFGRTPAPDLGRVLLPMSAL